MVGVPCQWPIGVLAPLPMLLVIIYFHRHMVGNNKQALRIHADRDEINTHNTKKARSTRSKQWFKT